MKQPKVTFYLLLSFMYFIPFCWIVKWVQHAPWAFYSLLIWALLNFGLLFVLYRLLNPIVKRREEGFRKPQTSEKKTQAPHLQARQQIKEVGVKEEACTRHLEEQKDRLVHEVKELTQLSIHLQSQLEKKETILSEYRSTLRDQRSVIEKKQSDINLLQIRVNDLKYELENVLKLKESVSEDSLPFLKNLPHSLSESQLREMNPPVGLLSSLHEKLDFYVKIAMALNSSYHLTKHPNRQMNLPLGSLIIDQRRLFDRLQNEETETLMVYSREEKRLIFINNQVSSLLGWSPERFLTDFSLLIQKNYRDWREALDEVKTQEHKNLRLIIKSKSGREVLTHCYLKEIPEGVFKGHVIGLLSSPTKH